MEPETEIIEDTLSPDYSPEIRILGEKHFSKEKGIFVYTVFGFGLIFEYPANLAEINRGN